MNDVTRVLEAIGQGRAGVAEELLPLVYEELCRLAARKLAHEPPGQTLQATALVHEAYMRRILIDRARRRQSERHGGGLRRVDLDSLELGVEPEDDQLLALNEALTRLEDRDKAKAELVKLRFFAGLSLPQAAEALGMPEGTAKRAWAFTRAWLYRELTRE